MFLIKKNSEKYNENANSMQDAMSKDSVIDEFDDKGKESLNTTVDNGEKSSESPFEISLTNVSIGNSISLGHYQQNVQGDKEEIRWKVIDIRGDKALLLSEKILFGQAYNKTDIDVTWEKSTLRNYLNNEFIKEVFNETERALSQVAGNGRAGSWWLRSPGQKQNYAATVTTEGKTRIPISLGYGEIGEVVSDDSIGVRPAIWIKVKNNSASGDGDGSLTGEGDDTSDNVSGLKKTQSVSLYERLVEDLAETGCYLVIGTDELEKEDALQEAEEARASGFSAHAICLYGKYYVSLGGYDLQDKADEILWYAIENGYPDSYIEYTGPAVAYSEISKID